MEDVDSLDKIQHDLIREALRLTGIDSGIEITTIADIPGQGTGLGSSSTVTVGLLNAMHAFQGRKVSKEQLAEEACQIEIDTLGAPIGRQDQYAASFGGVNSIRFGENGVKVEPIEVSEGLAKKFSENFTLVFTGLTRSASKVLSEESDDRSDKIRRMREIRNHADEAASHIEQENLDSLGAILNKTWLSKREVSSIVTNKQIDDLYEKAISSGAIGAKLLGAGNGGFLLVCGNRHLRGILQRDLGGSHRMFPLEIDFSGSKIIFGT